MINFIDSMRSHQKYIFDVQLLEKPHQKGFCIP
jgi:hypothetical protein